jgi:F-type H+-transporting ATPase subunit a
LVKLFAGVSLLLVLLGLALGAIGAALFGTDPFVPLPEVHLAPQEITTIGGFTITNTLLSAWLTTIVVILLFGFGSRSVKMIPGRLQGFVEMFIEAIYNFIKGVAGEKYARPFFPILATMFIFVAFNAWMALLPIYPTIGFKADGHDEITTHLLRSAGTDINMPLALAIISFLFAEIWGFKAQGFGYLKEFFRGPNPLDTFIGLIELLSHFIRVISFTFRLFGNMLAGEIVLFMMTFLLVFLVPLAFYGLELLVGGVQALIFMGLTVVFTTMGVSHGGHEEEHSEAGSH